MIYRGWGETCQRKTEPWKTERGMTCLPGIPWLVRKWATE